MLLTNYFMPLNGVFEERECGGSGLSIIPVGAKLIRFLTMSAVRWVTCVADFVTVHPVSDSYQLRLSPSHRPGTTDEFVPEVSIVAANFAG